MYNAAALSQYQSVEVNSKIAASNPHSLVAMLLDGLLKKLAIAGGAIKRKDIATKGESISSAIRIVDSLRASLDEKGGDLTINLKALYDYMERRLLEANMKEDTAIISEVTSLITEIKTGWDAIPNELRGA